DWSKDSTLIANLTDDIVQNEKYHLFDTEQMRCTILDSVWGTLQNNIGVKDVYYTMDGGKSLTFADKTPDITVPTDSPYQGSYKLLNP
ncbi:MAG: hypothetical protein LBN42_01285, partial [Oscillospiraceae bacterium]|nr:hypothetical protein [Oscillospiraceae bacterium]